MGLGTWLLFIIVPGWSDAFPQQLAGLIGATTGMVFGSLLPQWMRNTQAQVMHYQGSAV